jgi:succinate dehydrogenase/fumarate reductase cytochrome b subunit
VTPNARWLSLALAVVGWHSLLAELSFAARLQPALRWPALLLAFALPAAGAAILLRGPDLATHSGRRLRLWAHLATLAPVIATVLRVPQGLPTRPAWLALFGAPLAVSLWRGLRQDDAVTPSPVAAPPSPIALKLHRWSAAVIIVFAALHLASHLSAAISLALNTRVVDAARLVYKQPPVEALLLLALLIQIGTGLRLFWAARDRALGGWDRLQLASGLYLAVFLAGHTTATAFLFRDLNFRAASGGSAGLFGDPSFLAYYLLGPLAVFAHVACGGRSLILRRLGPVRAERLAAGALGLGAAVTVVIAMALCGIHLRNDRDRPQPRPAKVGWR